MYLEFHDISTGRSSHQASPDILGMFVQCAHVSRVLIVIHHLQTGNKHRKTQIWGELQILFYGARDKSYRSLLGKSFFFCIIYRRQNVWRTGCIAATQGLSFGRCVRAVKINWLGPDFIVNSTGSCILSPHPPTPLPPLSPPEMLSHCEHTKSEVRALTCMS